MDESFWAILKYFKLVGTLPGTGMLIVFIIGCLLLFAAVEISLHPRHRDRDKKIKKKCPRECYDEAYSI